MKQLITFVLLLTLAARAQAQTPIAEPDRSILMNIYNNCGGPGWINKTNWGTDTYPWFGVTVDAAGRVSELNLLATPYAGNNLTGTLPAINGLTNLQTFHCSKNQLTGNMPDLTGLINLQTFACNFNQLTGSIPSLTGLTNLQSFNCDYNQLTGNIPSLTGLTNLQTFYCGTNQLTGSIPSLTGLTNLQYFKCSYNRLTGNMPSLTGLTNLQTFNCSYNQLTGNIPSLTGLTNLQTFHCSYNQLTGSIPSLTGLISLQNFQCDNNQLTGNMPDLSELPNLRFFFCDNNKLSGNIPSLTGLTNLQYFKCGGNQLSGNIPSLTGLTNLQDFQCFKNQLTGNIPDLTRLTNLQTFWCSNNQLTGNIPSLSEVTNLSFFDCDNNQLTGITPFTMPPSMWQFHIDYNKINFTQFDNLTDPALINAMKTVADFWHAPQTVPVTISKTGNTISTDLAEGANPANYTYHWYKGTPGSGTLLTDVAGSNSVEASALTAAGAANGDSIYVTVTHNAYTIGTPNDGKSKYLSFTSNFINPPLPVSFGPVSATIANGQLLVHWSTLTETNNDHFIIEASKDGKTFTKLTEVKSQAVNGNSNAELAYNYATPLGAATSVLGALAFLGIGLAGFSTKKKLLLAATTVAVIAFTYSCSKKDMPAADAQQKIWVRIAQVDKDGTTKYSKAVEAVRE